AAGSGKRRWSSPRRLCQPRRRSCEALPVPNQARQFDQRVNRSIRPLDGLCSQTTGRREERPLVEQVAVDALGYELSDALVERGQQGSRAQAGAGARRGYDAPAQGAAPAQKRVQFGRVEREALEEFVRVKIDYIQGRAQHQGPVRVAAAMQPSQGAFAVNGFHGAV